MVVSCVEKEGLSKGKSAQYTKLKYVLNNSEFLFILK